MGSPFITETPAIVTETIPARDMASAAQLGFISNLITERQWNEGKDSWVRRIAVIAATLHIAERVATDDRTAQQLKIELFDRSDLFVTFHQLMSFSYDSAVNDERDPSQSKPLTKKGASALIEYLMGLAKKPTAEAKTRENYDHSGIPSAEVVPAGRYAVYNEDQTVNDIAFYKVDRPTEGRWAGRVFVKQIVGPEERRLSWANTKAILAKIAVDPAAASILYGQNTEHCGVCHTRLTRKESRERGIGPDCAKKYGW